MTVGQPTESLKLRPDADFGTAGDRPIDEGIEAVRGKGKTGHLCLSDGSHRETLQDGLNMLRPSMGAVVAGRSFRTSQRSGSLQRTARLKSSRL
jgi:hypothetical protein